MGCQGREIAHVPVTGSEGDVPSWCWQQEGLPSPFPADLPRPDPWGSLDQVCTSNPPPKLSISWARRGFCEGNCTTWVQMKAALSKAPENKKGKQNPWLLRYLLPGRTETPLSFSAPLLAALDWMVRGSEHETTKTLCQRKRLQRAES